MASGVIENPTIEFPPQYTHMARVANNGECNFQITDGSAFIFYGIQNQAGKYAIIRATTGIVEVVSGIQGQVNITVSNKVLNIKNNLGYITVFFIIGYGKFI